MSQFPMPPGPWSRGRRYPVPPPSDGTTPPGPTSYPTENPVDGEIGPIGRRRYRVPTPQGSFLPGDGAPFPTNAPPLDGGTGPSRTSNNDTQAIVHGIFANKPFNQQTILDAEQELLARGIRLTPPNAQGERTKIFDPTTQQWVRIGFGEGRPVWVPQGGSTGTGGGGPTPSGSALPPPPQGWAKYQTPDGVPFADQVNPGLWKDERGRTWSFTGPNGTLIESTTPGPTPSTMPSGPVTGLPTPSGGSGYVPGRGVAGMGSIFSTGLPAGPENDFYKQLLAHAGGGGANPGAYAQTPLISDEFMRDLIQQQLTGRRR